MNIKSFVSIGVYRLFLACLCCTGVALLADDNGKTVQQERLAKYSFLRTDCDPQAIGLLLGNAELGGLTDASGLVIPKLWGADLWKEDNERRAVDGSGLFCDEFSVSNKPAAYRQELGLADGVLRTRAIDNAGCGYEAELFCSMADRHLIVLQVKNLGGVGPRTWYVRRPVADYAVTRRAPDLITGQATKQGFTRDAWAIRLSKAYTTDAQGRESVKLAPGETIRLVYSLATQWDGAGYLQFENIVGTRPDYERLVKLHRNAWAALWRESATLALPDEAMERIWYRSVFWTLSTCGSEHFLPGEAMFSEGSWAMRPFTYGAAGWAVQALAAAGFPERARAMLNWHFAPDALRQNAEFYTAKLCGKAASPDAWSFAHEGKADGNHNPCDFWELQRHLDGFAASLFYRFNRLYPDQAYYENKVYPVLRGTATFWQGMARRDEPSGEFILPKMTSLTEDLTATNPIDAALAAKWCLAQAARAARELNRDADLRQGWQDLADKLCIPQNAERFLEYFGDEEKRAGGGYMGVRGFVYLSYPTVELIQQLDPNKAVRTLDYTWVRNKQGEGMIGFVANWFALADTHHGRGEHALSIMRHNLKCVDKWGTSLTETPGSGNYYFATGYASFILVPLSMAVQSADNSISVFPAVPSEWKTFAFYNVPAEAGVRVSGSMKDGRVQWASYSKDGKELLRLHRKARVTIQAADSKIKLTAATPES
jgi:hypothetical protein